MNLPTLEEYLKDFRERCGGVEDLRGVQQRVLNGECPFLDCNFEKDTNFRSMRRYYRQNLQSLQPMLLHIIDHVNEEVN